MTGARTVMKKQPSFNVALSLRFAREPEGGYTVTCKELPELITYGRTLDEALENAEDAFNAVVDAYEEQGHELPEAIKENHEVELNQLIEAVVPMKRQEFLTTQTGI